LPPGRRVAFRANFLFARGDGAGGEKKKTLPLWEPRLTAGNPGLDRGLTQGARPGRGLPNRGPARPQGTHGTVAILVPQGTGRGHSVSQFRRCPAAEQAGKQGGRRPAGWVRGGERPRPIRAIFLSGAGAPRCNHFGGQGERQTGTPLGLPDFQGSKAPGNRLPFKRGFRGADAVPEVQLRGLRAAALGVSGPRRRRAPTHGSAQVIHGSVGARAPKGAG